MRRKNPWSALSLSIFAATTAQIVVVSTAEASNDAALRGVVKNIDGDPIEGAVVVVTSDKLQGERTTTTDSTGAYRLAELPPGTYSIEVYHSGKKRTVSIELRAGITSTKNVQLRTTTEVDIIEIESPPVDTSSNSTGFAVDSEMARRVPIVRPTAKGGANRSFEAVAVATPGAAGDLYGTSVAGTTSPENKYYVDGLSVNDPGFGLLGTGLTVEFLEDVRVEVGGYMPEFGRATGGIVNAITKSGSNEFHGGVWVYFTPGQLEGRRKQPVRAGSTIQAERELLWLGDAGFDIGGRIIKDKLWFYGGVSISHTDYRISTTWNRLVLDDAGMAQVDPDTGFDVTERIPGTLVQRRAQGTTVQALAKLTYSPVSNHTIELLGIYAPTFSGGNGTYGINAQTGGPEVASGLGLYDTLAHSYRNNSADVRLEWNARLDGDWEVTTILGWHNQLDSRLPTDRTRLGSGEGLSAVPAVQYRQNNPGFHPITDFVDLPAGADSTACDPWVDPNDPTITVTPCPATQFVTGGPGFLNVRNSNRLQARSMVEHLAVGAGHHLIKFGVDFEYLQYESERGYSGTVYYRESTSGSFYQDYRRYGFLTGPDDVEVLDSLKWRNISTTIGGFLQDSWSIMDKVTLNAGLRYDAQHLFGGDGKLSLSLPNQLSPRVGLVWDPTQQGKAKIFGNYARFYQTVPLNLADRAGSGEPSLVSLYNPAVCDPSDQDSHEDVCQATDNSARFQYGAGADPTRYWYAYGAAKTAIDPKLKPQSVDEVIVGGEYEIIPGGKVGLTYQHRWFNRVVEDMSRDEATTYFIGNPGYGIAKDFPKGRRIYDAVILFFDKRFGRNWMVSGSYTLSWLRGNIAGAFRPETGQLDPNINSDFDLISLLDNRFGPLPGDRRHSFKLFAAGEIPLAKGHAMMLGAAFLAASGGPTNAYGSHSLYGADEAFLIPRGAGERLPWVFNIDTNIGYRKYFSKDLSMDITMDVFNVANFQAAVAVDETYTNSDVNPIQGGTLEDLETATDVNGDPIVKNPNFGNPLAFQTPRQFRFGVRLNF